MTAAGPRQGNLPRPCRSRTCLRTLLTTPGPVRASRPTLAPRGARPPRRSPRWGRTRSARRGRASRARATGRRSRWSATSTRSGSPITHVDDKGFLYFRGHRRLAGRGAASRSGVMVLTRDGRIAGRDRQEAQPVQEATRTRRSSTKDLFIDIGAQRRRRRAEPRSRRRRASCSRRQPRGAPRTTASLRARSTTASAAYVAARGRAPRRGGRRRARGRRSRSRRSARRSETSPARARPRTRVRPDVAVAIDVT